MTKTNWVKVIDDNWDTLTHAMTRSAYEIGNGDGDSIIRVELEDNGHVSSYWTTEGITSADVRDGKAIVIASYYGGDCWTPEWAEEYDAAAVLDDFRAFMIYMDEAFDETFPE